MSEQIAVQPTSINDLQPKMRLEGKVTRTELYGAFVSLGLEHDGLIHISHLSPKHVKKVTDEVKVGDEVVVWVLNVDAEKGRIALTMVEPPDVDWTELETDQVRTGTVVRVERYGVFVDIGAERPGLLHAREMGQYVRNPADFVKMGETIEVKILKLDRRKRQIDLTMNLEPEELSEEEDDEPLLSAMEIAYRQAQSTNRSRRERDRMSKRKSSRDDFDDIYRRTLENR